MYFAGAAKDREGASQEDCTSTAGIQPPRVGLKISGPYVFADKPYLNTNNNF